jgi:hypothetical protein
MIRPKILVSGATGKTVDAVVQGTPRPSALVGE